MYSIGAIEEVHQIQRENQNEWIACASSLQTAAHTHTIEMKMKIEQPHDAIVLKIVIILADAIAIHLEELCLAHF